VAPSIFQARSAGRRIGAPLANSPVYWPARYAACLSKMLVGTSDLDPGDPQIASATNRPLAMNIANPRVRNMNLP
jgi:hypothetical protein